MSRDWTNIRGRVISYLHDSGPPHTIRFGVKVQPETILSVVALLVSGLSAIVTIWLYNRELRLTNENHLSGLWHNILDISRDNPRYLDVNVTEGYKKYLTHDERVRYDIYCQKAWGHVHEVVERGLHSQPRFLAAIQWLVTFHLEWLKDNPAFFQNREFWKAVDRGKNEPAVILRHRKMPTLDSGEIDWDSVSEDYHSHVLSPYNPEMLDEANDGTVRNLLVNRIKNEASKLEEGDILEIADFGCGIGNLAAALTGYPVRIVGVDISEDSLTVAEQVAKDSGVDFTPIQADLSSRDFDLGRKFDVIVSSNSVLPSDRHDVMKMLHAISRHLEPRRGRLFAIFPSFDTTEYLASLWRKQFLKVSGDELHADRVVTAFRKSKKSDPETLSYADDGITTQSYHDLTSLNDELPLAGLEIVEQPAKVYYPWEVARHFDYGWFPDAPEEIWDWFIVAKLRGPSESGVHRGVRD